MCARSSIGILFIVYWWWNNTNVKGLTEIKNESIRAYVIVQITGPTVCSLRVHRATSRIIGLPRSTRPQAALGSRKGLHGYGRQERVSFQCAHRPASTMASRACPALSVAETVLHVCLRGVWGRISRGTAPYRRRSPSRRRRRSRAGQNGAKDRKSAKSTTPAKSLSPRPHIRNTSPPRHRRAGACATPLPRLCR